MVKVKKSVSEELRAEFRKEINQLRKELKDDFNYSKKNKKKDDDSEALFIPAGVLTGLGAGFLFGNVPAGLFLGLGAGFVLFALIAVIKSFKK